jgi:hypothetical protein
MINVRSHRLGFEAQTKYCWTLDKRVSEEEEEGRVALNGAYIDDPNGDGGISPLDTELPATRPQKKKVCCMCCGLE